MKRFFSIFLMVIILSLVIGACGPAVDQSSPPEVPEVKESSVMVLGLGATASALVRAANGASGTFMYAAPDMKTILFGWQTGANSYGFFSIGNQAGLAAPVDTLKTMMNGNRVNTMTMTDFIKYLEGNNWTQITPAQLPAPIAIALQSAQTWLATMAQIHPVIPIFIFPAAPSSIYSYSEPL